MATFSLEVPQIPLLIYQYQSRCVQCCRKFDTLTNRYIKTFLTVYFSLDNYNNNNKKNVSLILFLFMPICMFSYEKVKKLLMMHSLQNFSKKNNALNNTQRLIQAFPKSDWLTLSLAFLTAFRQTLVKDQPCHIYTLCYV